MNSLRLLAWLFLPLNKTAGHTINSFRWSSRGLCKPFSTLQPETFCCLSRSLFNFFCLFLFFFLRTLKIHMMADKAKDDSYSSLIHPPAHHHWDIYLQLCIWGDSVLLLIAEHVINRLLKREAWVFSIRGLILDKIVGKDRNPLSTMW